MFFCFLKLKETYFLNVNLNKDMWLKCYKLYKELELNLTIFLE